MALTVVTTRMVMGLYFSRVYCPCQRAWKIGSSPSAELSRSLFPKLEGVLSVLPADTTCPPPEPSDGDAVEDLRDLCATGAWSPHP